MMPPTSHDNYVQLPRRQYFANVQWHAAPIALIAAMVLLVGYGLGIEAVQSVVPGFPTMKARTATLILLLAVSCLLSLRSPSWATWASSALAIVVIVIAFTMGVNRTPSIPGDPWSMSPSNATIFGLACGGVAMLLINHAPRWTLAAGIIALAAAAPAIFRIIALLMFGGAPDENSPLNTMALHTATLISWFMLVCVMLHPKLGFAQVLLRPSLQGRLLRTMLPVAVLLPVGAAAVTLFLSHLIGTSVETLFAMDAAIYLVMGAAMVWQLSLLVEQWQGEANERSTRLSRANGALEQYALSAAHDLKAPGRHMLLYGELLQEALDKGDVAAARKYASSIRDSALDMPKIIEGMLDFSRSAFTRISPTLNTLSELVQAAAAQNADGIQAANGAVKVLTEARLRCDPTLITSVFQNLIANAVKHRRSDRRLEIRIDAQREEQGWRISVEDNGMGFDPDFAALAFNPLARGVQAAGEGTGIGLSTCRSIVQGHGGRIRIDQDYRGGARVVFTLPDALPQADS
jgi:signal transduction histidine kinase